MRHLFWRLNFLLLSGATNSAQMYHEAAALSSELDTRWSYRSKELMTLYSKAKSYEAGERVEFGGKSFAPLYTPKNDTLINLFQISQQEQEQLLMAKPQRLPFRRPGVKPFRWLFQSE
ncbi:hypothetical protein ACH7AJ_24910 [Klebsiella aerogenes]|uniref:hypothetical protein n=1 Tax=Klebsiella aerogenes TaxID=548 RepID=UPI003789F083